jgi:cytoskeletal protein RodZ
MAYHEDREGCEELETFIEEPPNLASLETPKREDKMRRDIQRTTSFFLYSILLTSSVLLNIIMLSQRPVVWHETDIRDARKAVAYEKRTFSGALVYNRSTKSAARLHDGQQEFFGEPGLEIDRTWEDLLRGTSDRNDILDCSKRI